MNSARIKVAIRLRPFLPHEVRNGYENNRIQINQNSNEVSVNIDDHYHNHKTFKFDHVFRETITQEEVYSGCEIDHLIDKAIQGYHSTIFAYGQTGSGKTYTMQGESFQQQNKKHHQFNGIVPKVVSSLFKKIKNKMHQRTFSIYISYLQIYSEKIFDLLNPASLNPKNNDQKMVNGLRLRWNQNEQFTVENLFVFECKNAEELLKFFAYGLSNRITSSHKLNMSSSRSHTILTIRVESFDNNNPNHILTSKIELVDLAGSERISLTGNEGKQAKQSIDINKSLFTLRQVISTLAQWNKTKDKEERTHIPYRESKLTAILKQSIGGNSYCLMIACINPNDDFLDQNISTLTYATKAAYIANKPKINDDPRNKIIVELKYQIQKLNSELQKANKHIQMMNQLNLQPKLKSQKSQATGILLEETIKPILKSKISEKIGASYQQFSDRLIESINMVRELLKNNKELRQQLQIANKKIQEKNIQIYWLSQQNQRLREGPIFVPEKAHQIYNKRLKAIETSFYQENPNSAVKIPKIYSNNITTMKAANTKTYENTYSSFNSLLDTSQHRKKLLVTQHHQQPTNFMRREAMHQDQQLRLKNINNVSKQQIKEKKMQKYRRTTTMQKNLKKQLSLQRNSIQKRNVTEYYNNQKAGGYYY